MTSRPRVLVAPDKFKGTASAAEVAAAMATAVRAHGVAATTVAMSDGGDGLLAVFGGANRATRVSGPDGTLVDAGWRSDGALAVVESALASGLTLAGGRDRNDPVRATSRGTGELIEAAVRAGARRVVVGLGGSATTDGGLPAIDALSAGTRSALASGAMELVVCCDVDTRYTDAARVFGPQKGATAAQVSELGERLDAARQLLLDTVGVDVDTIAGSGAAGGLGGALAAIGGRLRSGFEVVAQETDLERLVADADLVVTGEGRMDAESFAGKVVGGVLAIAARHHVPAVVVAGDVTVATPVPAVSLATDYGVERATGDVLACVEDATGRLVAAALSRRRSG